MGGGVTQSFTGTIATSNTMANCTYKLPVTATSGSITHSTSVFVTVNNGTAPDFTVATYNITTMAGYGFDVGATLGLSGCMTGTPSFSLTGGFAGTGITIPATGQPPVSGPASVVSYFTVNVAAGTAPGTYSGQLTVTIAGSTHSTPFAVTIYQPTYASYSLNGQRAAGTTVTNIPQGGSAPVYVVLVPSNGYTGVPSLSAASLPPGINVTFSDNALETYGVVTATISAGYQAAVGATSVWVNGFDGTASYSLNIPFTVIAAPLKITTALMFSNANPTAPHNAQLATVRVATTGGAAPFTYTWLSNGAELGQTQSPVYSISAPTSAMNLAVTVTDSSTSVQSARISMTIPAAPPLPEALLHTAVLTQAAALNDFANHLLSEGKSNAYPAGLIMSKSGLTQTQYNAVVAQATARRADLASIQAGYSTQTASLHKQGLTATSASGSVKTSLQSIYGTASALPTTYYNNLTTALGSAFAQLDSYAWSNVAPLVTWCNEGGCICAEDDSGTCGAPSGDDPTFEVYADNWIDPQLEIWGTAMAQVSGFGEDVTDGMTEITNLTMDGANNSVNTPGQFEADATISGDVFQPGNYIITADGDTTLTYLGGAMWSAPGHDSHTASYSGNGGGTTCSGPVITGVLVHPGSSPQAQPTSGLMIGGQGWLQVNAACIDGSAQLFVSSDDVTLMSIAASASVVTADYSVNSAAQAETLTLVLTTDTGVSTTPIQIVPSWPYITSMFPGWWQAGQQTCVTISGAGFGGGGAAGAVAGTLNLSQQANYVTLIPAAPGNTANCQPLWSDNTINAIATVSSGEPGETVSVSVTAGTYGNGFLPNPAAGTTSGSDTAEAGGQAANAQVTQVQFTNSYSLVEDNGTSSPTSVSNVVWQQPTLMQWIDCKWLSRRKLYTGSCFNESAFQQGTKIEALVTFSLPACSCTPGIPITFTGTIVQPAGLGKLISSSIPLNPSGGLFTVTVTGDTALPTGTHIYPSITVNWVVSAGGPQIVAGQSSSGPVYVTMGTPPASITPLPLTILELAVGQGGANTPGDAFRNTWNLFSSNGGPANIQTWDRQPLSYYPANSGFSACAYGSAYGGVTILDARNYAGQCGEFAWLMQSALAVNGIQSGLILVQAIDNQEEDFMIKNWQPFANAGTGTAYPNLANLAGLGPWWQIPLYTEQGGGPGMVPDPTFWNPVFLRNQFGDLNNANGLPGQNSSVPTLMFTPITPPAPSEKIFDYHFIVEDLGDEDGILINSSAGPYYDPSYGKAYTGACGPQAGGFEHDAVAGYVTKETVAQLGVPDKYPSYKGTTSRTFLARQPGPTCNISFLPIL